MTVQTGSHRWEVSGRQGATDGNFPADGELPMGTFRQGGTGTIVRTGNYRWEVSGRQGATDGKFPADRELPMGSFL